MNTKKKGISLIVLVITIIVMLILAAAIILTLNNNKIMNNANKAVTDSNLIEVQAAASLGWLESYTNGARSVASLQEGVDNYLIANNIATSQYNITVTENGANVTGTLLTDVFDINGMRTTDANYDVSKLHIGDFVNYNAGTWQASEIAAIQTGTNDSLVTANGTRALPTTGFQFGGFATGDSRNGSAVSYSTSYSYVTENGTTTPVTGWRVFDVDTTTGVVKLISAGCPEDYYHPYGSGKNYAYVSEYILTGTSSSENYSGSYTKRNWNVYVNDKATSATILTYVGLQAWYTKYVSTSLAYTDSTSFGAINGTQYESLIDNYSYYWLASASNDNGLYYVYPGRSVNGYISRAFGVRPVVTLNSNIHFTKNANAKNVTSRGVKYTYNVWDIQ